MKGLQVSIIAAFVLAAISLAGTVYFFTQIDGERKSRIAAEKNISEMQSAVQEKDKQLQDKTQNLSSLESQMDEIKAEVRNKNQELTKNLNKIAQSDTKIKDLTEKIRLLDKENKDLKARVEYFEKQQADQDQVSVQQAEESSIPGLAAAIEQKGSSAISSTPAQKTPEKPASGKVVLVNREYNFIVAGIGKLDGINLKDQLDIVRGDKVIGKVAVTKLYDSLSSCEILQEGKSQIKEGDIVRVFTKA
ncbi:MAG: hypothetical protein HZC17_00455 [Candidatus Omnitrophica bacterium]|nr:hypothetical protein [Candidatus Omnitrophota bacterium]